MLKRILSATFNLVIISILISCEAVNDNSKVDNKEGNWKLKVYEKQNNLFALFPDSTKKQLTFTGLDSQPIYLEEKDKILFQRIGDKNSKSLMIIDDSTLNETELYEKTDKISNLKVSKNEDYIFFIDERKSLIILNIDSIKHKKIPKSFYFVPLENKQSFKRLLVINADPNSYPFEEKFNIYDFNGVLTKKISDKQNLKAFISQNYPQQQYLVDAKIDSINILINYIGKMYECEKEMKILEKQLNEKQSEIKLSFERMAEIKEYKLLRSEIEKRKQVRDQTKLIQLLQKEEEILRNEVDNLKSECFKVYNQVNNM